MSALSQEDIEAKAAAAVQEPGEKPQEASAAAMPLLLPSAMAGGWWVGAPLALARWGGRALWSRLCPWRRVGAHMYGVRLMVWPQVRWSVGPANFI